MSQRQKAISRRQPLRRFLKYARQPRRSVGELLCVMFPDLPEDSRESLLWEETGWPAFWSKSDGTRCLVEQLLDVRQRIDAHRKSHSLTPSEETK